ITAYSVSYTLSLHDALPICFDVVTTQYDAGNLQFKRAIRQFEDAASEADIAVIYYAGHGIEIHGQNYLVPIDANFDAVAGVVDRSEEHTSELQSRENIVCRL